MDFDRTFQNETGNLTFRRFGISKYYQYSMFKNTFQCHYTRIFETRSVSSNGIQTWKIYKANHFESIYFYFEVSMNIKNHLYQQVQYYRVEWILMMKDLHQSTHSNSFNTFDYC